MSERDQRIVSFQRPVDYWVKRARRAQALNRLPDAAKMLRKALEQGASGKAVMELASVYRRMGCISAAERCMMRSAAEEGLTPELCYETGLCALERYSEIIAEDALDACIRLSPGSVLAHESQEILENYPWSYVRPDKRTARSRTRCLFAHRRLDRGDMVGALEWAQKAWAVGKTGDSATAMALTQVQMEKALPYAQYAVEKKPAEALPLMLLARVHDQMGHIDQARQALEKGAKFCFTLQQVESLTLVAERMGFYDLVLSLVDQKLKRYPYSADYLLLRYRTLIHLGRREEAKRVLQTVLEVDPVDPCGKWYADHPKQGSSIMIRLPFLPALGALVSSVRNGRKKGPLNRLLHLFAFSLRREADARQVYAAICPLWARLNDRERQALDRRDSQAIYHLYVYVLFRLGKRDLYGACMENMPGSNRAGRKMKRYLMLTREDI